MATSNETEAADGNLDTEISEETDADQPGDSSRVVYTTVKSHPVDHGWAWVVMIGSFGVHFLSFGYIRSFGILFLEFQTKFEASSAMTAVVVGVQFCVYSITTFLVVNVGLKRFSVRQSCLLGSCFQCLGILLNGVVPDITYLLFTQGLLFGMGLAMIYCPSLIIVSEYFNARRAISTAIAASGVSAGGVTLPFLMRYFVEHYGLQGGLLLLSAVMLNQAVFVSLFTPPSQYSFVSAPTPKTDSAPTPKTDSARTVKTDSARTVKTDSARTVKTDSGQEYDRMKQGDSDENEGLVTRERDLADNPLLDQKPSSRNSNYTTRGESSSLFEKYSSGQFDRDQESIGLLQKYPNGSQISTQPVVSDVVVSTSDRHTAAVRSDHRRSDLCHDITNSIREQMFDEHVDSSSQTESLDNHSPNPNQAKSLLLNENETKQSDHPDKRYQGQDISLFQNDHLSEQSLKESVLQVLSTSGTDLYGTLYDVSSTTMVASHRHPRTPGTREGKRTTRWRCRLPAVTKTLSFWLLLVFFGCGGVGSGLPPIFLPPLAKEKGMQDMASFLLMMSAVTEVVGRLLPGVILHYGFMGPCAILITPLAACGTLYQFTALYDDFGSLLAMSLLIGLFTGSFWTMQSLVVIDIYGMERLGPLLGFYVLIVGLSMGASNPFSGFLRDVSGSYSVTFHFFGIMYYIAALMMIIVLVRKRIVKKKSLDAAGNRQDIPLQSPPDSLDVTHQVVTRSDDLPHRPSV